MEITKKTFINDNVGKPGWSDRKDFTCMEYTLNYSEDKAFIDKIIEKSEKLMPRINDGEANSSEKRDLETKKIDVISGFLAEAISLYFYGEIGGDENFYNKETTSSFHQIDLNTTDGKTIEIRSSFVFGFPNIPLFHLNKEPAFDGHASYNIPCTYTNKYKNEDIGKDFYTLLMFSSKKETFLEDIKNNITFYITGTATKNEVDKYGGFGNLKSSMIKSTGADTRYKIVPIHTSLDVEELEKYFI